jgi:hypothetical protein
MVLVKYLFTPPTQMGLRSTTRYLRLMLESKMGVGVKDEQYSIAGVHPMAILDLAHPVVVVEEDKMVEVEQSGPSVHFKFNGLPTKIQLTAALNEGKQLGCKVGGSKGAKEQRL